MSVILKRAKESWFRITDGSLTNSKTLSVLWILPVIHLLVSMIVQRHFGYFFLWVTDPEYFHLMSGIAFSRFHLDATYIAHPGTPIQIVVAISAWFNYLISGSDNMLIDVAKNPEQYIFAANLLFNIILMFIIYWTGRKTALLTQNINAAFLLQLGFFISFNLVRVTGRLLPEGFMLLPIAVLIILTLRYLYEDIPKEKQKKQLILFSIVIGWGVATKLSFAPFVLVPFIIFRGTKNKIYLILFSIVSFLIIAFPVPFHLNKFIHWVSNMSVHTGKWGHGPSGFMDFSQFPHRLKLLYNFNSWLFIFMAILFIETIWLLKSRNKDPFLKRYLRVSFAFLAGAFFFVFLICKHFVPHYLIPAILLNGFFILLIIIPLVKITGIKRFYFAGVLAGIVFTITTFTHFSVDRFPSVVSQQKKICAFNEKINENDLLIISGYYSGTPFKEFSLAGGIFLSGPAMKTFTRPLKSVYPNTYLFYDWTEKFFHWTEYSGTKVLLIKNQPIYIYTGKEKEADLQKILTRFTNENPGYNFKTEPVIDSEEYPEKLYLLIYQKKE